MDAFQALTCVVDDYRVARLSTCVARLPEGKIDRRETYVLGCTEHPGRRL
jgi:hypothetical protein